MLKFISLNNKPVPNGNEKLLQNKPYIYWGEDNLYPQFLVKLFYDSPYQSGIIKGKSLFITSSGYEVEYLSAEGKEAFKAFEANEYGEDLQTVIDDLALELELLDGIALKITPNNGSGIYKYEVPGLEKIRASEDKDTFFYSENWAVTNQTEKTGYYELPALDKDALKNVSIYYYANPSKVYELKGTKQATNVYPRPSYTGGIKDILTDIETSVFHYHEIINNFKGSTIINFVGGEPTDEEKQEIYRDYKEGLTPTENAGGIMINFVNGREMLPEIQHVNGTDLDKRYLLLEEAVRKKIFVAHGVTSPALFGIATQGALGSTQELKIAFEIFKKTYVRQRQGIIESYINYLLKTYGIAAKIKLKEPEAPFLEENKQLGVSTEVKDENKEELLIQKFNEIGTTDLNGRIVYSEELTELDNVAAYEATLKAKVRKQKQSLTEIDALTLQYIKDGKQIPQISTALGLTNIKTLNTINKLIREGYLNDKGELTSKAKDILDVATFETEIYYSYELRDDVEPTKKGSRPFCTALMGLKPKYYTRQEIENLNTYTPEGNAFRYRGGWYANPTTKRNEKGCRHYWQSHVIIK